MPLFDEEFERNSYRKWEEGVDKEFATLAVNFTVKGMYRRTILEPKVRQLCVIAALTATNALPQLGLHIKYAFRAGATEAEIKEAIIQMVSYCGFPYINMAFEKYQEVARELGKSK